MYCSPRELCSGVDALYLSAQGVAPSSLLSDLEAARLQAEADGLPVDFSLGGYPAKVLPRAFGRYRYAVAHELGMIGITASDNLPVVRVQPTAVAIHALGPSGTVLWAENVLDATGVDASLHVARLDLHSDWQGFEVKAHERSNFVTYSDRRALYEVAEEMSGLNFGKRGGKLYARIYDKSREMVEKGHDWWPEVWGAAYDPERKVTRIEFEFSRAGLVEFGIDTPTKALTRMSELWAYATMQWLSLRTPTDDDTRSRWPVDPRWELVQASTLAGGCAPAHRIKAAQRQGQLRTYRKLATGVLSSMALPMGTVALSDTLQAVKHELRNHEFTSGRGFRRSHRGEGTAEAAMSEHPAWEIVAKILVDVELRRVLAQQAQEATEHVDDRLHQSVDGGSDRLLPRCAEEALPTARDQ